LDVNTGSAEMGSSDIHDKTGEPLFRSSCRHHAKGGDAAALAALGDEFRAGKVFAIIT